MKKAITLIMHALFFAFLTGNAAAQNTFPKTGSAGIGTTSPTASSILDIRSTTKGILIPRMTMAQRDSIASPASGLLIYQTNNTKGFYFYSGSAWTSFISKGWLLTGNSQTIPGINFLGTTDAQPLMLKVNNQKSGYIDYSNTKANSAFGYQALLSNTTGAQNTSMGYQSLFTNTTGSSNTAAGSLALLSNTSGFSNVGIGANALSSNTTRSNLVAIGDSALYNNGKGATDSSEATENTALGSKALYNNTMGIGNTAAGYNALYSNIDGYWNTATGNYSLEHTDHAIENAAYGTYSSYFNTSGSYNIAIGSQALLYNDTGYFNSATGAQALIHTKANHNTASGFAALSRNRRGTGNTAIGSLANANDSAYDNSIALGFRALITASDQVRIGNPEITSIGGFTDWSNISDGRVKKNITANVPGLTFINKLTPVTYNLDLDAVDKILQRPEIKDMAGKIMPTTENVSSRKVKETVLYTGFIAQDVEQAAKSIKYDFSGVDVAKNSKDLYGLRYGNFVVPLVKAVQQLSKMNDDKDAKISELEARLEKIEALLQINTSSASLSSASLDQNNPNPFSGNTTISYNLPQNYSKAQLIITDKSGKTVKAINVSGSGKGSMQVDAAALAAGAYNYSMTVDGKLVDTKQMILAK